MNTRTKLNWLWFALQEPRVFILEREWTTRAQTSIAETFASLWKRVNSRMSVCLCERGARIHASPRIAYYADFRQETPVHTTLCVCRLSVIWDHYTTKLCKTRKIQAYTRVRGFSWSWIITADLSMPNIALNLTSCPPLKQTVWGGFWFCENHRWES